VHFANRACLHTCWLHTAEFNAGLYIACIRLWVFHWNFNRYKLETLIVNSHRSEYHIYVMDPNPIGSHFISPTTLTKHHNIYKKRSLHIIPMTFRWAMGVTNNHWTRHNVMKGSTYYKRDSWNGSYSTVHGNVSVNCVKCIAVTPELSERVLPFTFCDYILNSLKVKKCRDSKCAVIMTGLVTIMVWRKTMGDLKCPNKLF
jgi:hypothetical protein